MAWEFLRNGLAWELVRNGEKILSCNENNPLVYVGSGTETVNMHRGNFQIEDYVTERYPLKVTGISEINDGKIRIDFAEKLSLELLINGDCAELFFIQKDKNLNRFWFRVHAEANECCYGCGEQMSYFNLRGRHFPLWTSEPGVGRDKTTYITWRSDVENHSGGDYYNTNFPLPVFVSSRCYYLYVNSTAYADFDFRNKNFHELQIWEVPSSIRIEAANSFTELLEKESSFFGRQPLLPDWIYDGIIAGLQGGTERVQNLLKKTLEHGIKVNVLWCQDWCGKRVTSFGKRLQWDWHYNQEMYPNLPEYIKKLHNNGIRFFGYVNPYLVNDGKLYEEGRKKGVFAKHADGSEYLVDFGEFHCGVVDLTNKEAYDWFKDDVIKKHSLEIGIDGYMADFGEYLPVDDIVLSNGKSPMIEHNLWPTLWAKCNYDALKESGKLSDAVFFMRAGGIGSQKYCTLLWAGDQSVDFSIHDGLASVICGALSAGICGCGFTHSDIGGYTSLYGNVRTKELFLRWAEMAVFTPVMRTHEGNRPEENFQYYNDEDCMNQLARLVNIHVLLKPYLKDLAVQNSEKGLPVQRPLFIHYENDQRCYHEQTEYLLGPDILVAPVYLSEQTERKVYLPQGNWIHLWSGKSYTAGDHTVEAKIGNIPVFYKADSSYAEIFDSIREKYGSV